MHRWLPALIVPCVLVASACSSGGDEPAAPRRTSTTSSATMSSTTSTSPGTSSGTTPSGTNAPPAGGGGPTAPTSAPGSAIAMTGPTGSGSVSYTLAPERSELCYRITVKGIGTPTGAHVHRVSGDVALALRAPGADSTVDTCSATDALLIDEIASRPGNFYVDVHSAKGVLKATLR